MSASCCFVLQHTVHPKYRRAVWIALVVNLSMFGAEIVASQVSGSVSLMADAIDFFGDAGNYGISLAVVGLSLATRAKAAPFKATCMGAFGVFILGKAAWSLKTGVAPAAATMGVIDVLGLSANLSVTFMLYRFREGDANTRSVWICTRNDAIGNVAVLLAAVGVFGSGSAWPDLLAAAAMAGLALTVAATVLKHARRELRPAHAR